MQHLAGEVGRRAVASRRGFHSARIRPQLGKELIEIARRKARMSGQDNRGVATSDAG
jgi:hypothetical protein